MQTASEARPKPEKGDKNAAAENSLHGLASKCAEKNEAFSSTDQTSLPSLFTKGAAS